MLKYREPPMIIIHTDKSERKKQHLCSGEPALKGYNLFHQKHYIFIRGLDVNRIMYQMVSKAGKSQNGMVIC